MAHVLVVGAGPAGVTLAYLLARRGIRVTLLERHSDFTREFRGEGLMPSGIDVFSQLGLRRSFDSLPHIQIEQIQLYYKGRHLFHIELEAEQLGFMLPRVVPQSAMLAMMVSKANCFPSFQIEQGVTVKDVLWQCGRVAGVLLYSHGCERKLRGDFVVAADGRTSIVRKRAGFDVTHRTSDYNVLWHKIPVPDFLEGSNVIRFYVNADHWAVVFPSYDKQLQIGWVVRKDSSSEPRLVGTQAWVEEMARHVSPDLAQYLRSRKKDFPRPFLLNVIAGYVRHWSAPGLLLVGDAAHPMAPVGAQGINIALRDAVIAANHLCPVLEQPSPPAAIDAAAALVEEKRRKEIVTIQRMQEAQSRLFLEDSWQRRSFLPLLPLLGRIGVAQQLYRYGLRRMAAGITTVRLEV